jgi:primosomal protein N' (replication factor Y) (superfamily II helicase)
LANEICELYECHLSEIIFKMFPSGKRPKDTVPTELAQAIELPPLLPDQKKAVDELKIATQLPDSSSHLIEGITGSGKTRIYLEMVHTYLKQNLGILFLLPEIALSYQFLDSWKPRYGDKLAILHSGLSQSERLAEYQRVLTGEATFVIGTRSAIFAPVANLGLIILDEEHDQSYKENSTPFYHARQIAILRLRQPKDFHRMLILGSATPCAETFFQAKLGNIQHHKLNNRATGLPLPKVTVPLKSKIKGFIGPELKQAMEQHLKQGNQVLLLMNRRGFSQYAQCSQCGESPQCQHCSISLTHHKTGELRCHLCGYSEPWDKNCHACPGERQLIGVAIQKVEEQIEKLFPEIPFARLDQDTGSEKGYTRDILQAMRAEKIKILLGTQMIAKGFDLPGVTLVGVLNTDAGLHIPDFRGHERLFQLLVQAAGRAGRHKNGEVFLQSMQPDHPVIQFASRYDYNGFIEFEITQRKKTGFPPFMRMVKILLTGIDEQVLMKIATRLREQIKSPAIQEGLFTPADLPAIPSEILGPAPAPIEKMKDKYRVQLFLLDRNLKPLREAIGRCHKLLGNATELFHYTIDLDPQDLL